MKQLRTLVMAAVLALLVSSELWAQGEIVTLEGTRIRGDQEVPLVLYLVPWQPPEARSLDRPDEQLMLARPIKPLVRSEFRRLLGYHEHFRGLHEQSDAAEGAASALK